MGVGVVLGVSVVEPMVGMVGDLSWAGGWVGGNGFGGSKLG